MAKRWPPKDPDEILDYAIDWTARLGGDTVAQSQWIMPTGLTKDSDSKSPTMTIIWLSGGTLNKTYDVLNRVITTGGRTFDQTVRLKVKTK
jgi:hypothetical protein